MRVREGYLEAVSTCSRDVRDVLAGAYDIGLFTASWDRRCLCSIEAVGLRVSQAMVLCFRSGDEFGRQADNERLLCQHFESRGAKVHRIEGVSEAVETEWERIWTTAKALAGGIPVRCLVDLSTCPRYYSLGFIAGMVATGLASEIHVFYAEGRYHPVADAPHPSDVPFSLGRWSNIPVPFLRGEFKPSHRKSYLVSVGFEGTKTLRVLERDDPERISILYPIPGALPTYDDEVLTRNAPILERFRVPDEQVLRVAAGDAVGVWDALSRRNLEGIEEEDLYYLCCGTKAHALGMALRAMTLRAPTVLYNVPERHNFVEVSPSGTFWVYRIKDFSSLAPPAR